MAKQKINTLTQMDLPSKYEAEGFCVGLKDHLDTDFLRKTLISLNYENMNISPVERPGQFSIRGGLVDIWPERYKNPVRIDFFGGRVEAIYQFDSVLHHLIRNLKEVTIFSYTFTNTPVTWPKGVVEKFERLFISDIKPGDLVVHIDHGVGRFLRIDQRNLEGTPRYYLLIEYAKGEKLYVPVQQIDRLSKYIGVGSRRPPLNHLGTSAWERTKKKVREDLVVVAKELLKIYALREQKKRPAYEIDSSWQQDLESEFPHVLTPSQEKALMEIKQDLEGEKPMDRLLVGDVGFGKTELALRTAFKVIQSGSQVVLLAPTSILSEQHYHTFSSRLERFPVEVRLLSRFQSPSEQQEILRELREGKVDILIGTHRVLSKDVEFKKLGFLIIDEEHKFGVMAKEKLKKLRPTLDVLALSATPIPRSLYLSLTKIRDISLISDPPLSRLAVQNYIGPYDSALVKEALDREISRGGQVYYLHNRVQSIQGETQKIQKLIPQASVATAHAQMNDQSLEETMKKFFDERIQVLVCSTIVGSGLDVARANTIIIRDAHKFGLADLYQLRGRVGRSSEQAYAYFFYPRGYLPKGTARDRLEAISEASALGDGFNLAEKDLEIRGAGNLLGVEQHGSVSMVGFELYLQLLKDAVNKYESA